MGTVDGTPRRVDFETPQSAARTITLKFLGEAGRPLDISAMTVVFIVKRSRRQSEEPIFLQTNAPAAHTDATNGETPVTWTTSTFDEVKSEGATVCLVYEAWAGDTPRFWGEFRLTPTTGKS